MASSRIAASLSLLCLAALAACNQSAAPPKTPAERPPSRASLDWRQAADGFVQSYFDAQPFFAAQAGKHEFDGRLPDLSEHGLKREIARLHAERDRIAGIDPAPLEPRERFDRDYLLAVANRDLFWLE